MKKLTLFLMSCLPLFIAAQEVIDLPFEKASAISWSGSEKEYFSQIWDNQVTTNVSIPRMEVFRPENPNGTAVIIAPGGGLYALSIESEGRMVAEWLNERGITAFVLKYRLVPTGEDGVKEITVASQSNPAEIMENVSAVIPFSVKDGLNAISFARKYATTYSINPDKIGFMGFSAGGAVLMGVAYSYDESNRPDFLVPVYPWTTAMPVQDPPESAPPMLVICASDDPLLLAPGSVELYSSWLNNSLPAGLHMYSKGGHGFGMKSQGLPSDDWISRVYDWMLAEELTNRINQ
ncbi:alpha/beta hydrolase [Zeaxanthinibacter sp. PT1]|uniref:alpha/beta hydrolase n=1 Tax=Zeaxanthinibacter TaxID=561554 RepID=UPI002348F3AC|nr:alpha/beta hydrolase [Zeaxanthinibacter sp. PT1]MDC6352548.1 alpha/beta hydrolase [Zeaxanthinibacter sp. PT1]